MVLTIFGIITAIVSFNYGAFNNQIVLGNLAYEIAMQVREAQVLSLGVRGANNDFDDRYGVYFVAGSNSFISFIDKENGGVADGLCKDGAAICDCVGTDDECQKNIILPRKMKIESFKDLLGQTLNGPIYVTFDRPNPEAIIKQGDGTTITTGVDIIISSPDKQYKKITIRQNGYMSVGDVVNYVP